MRCFSPSSSSPFLSEIRDTGQKGLRCEKQGSDPMLSRSPVLPERGPTVPTVPYRAMSPSLRAYHPPPRTGVPGMLVRGFSRESNAARQIISTECNCTTGSPGETTQNKSEQNPKTHKKQR